MNYLRYSNLCASLVRKALKDSPETQKKVARDVTNAHRSIYEGGKVTVKEQKLEYNVNEA